MPRPEFEVTDQLRRRVSILAGAGWTHEEISIAIGCSRPTLEKHFEDELAEVAYQRRAEAVEALHAAAVKGNVTAAREYLANAPRLAQVPHKPEKPDPPLGKKEKAAQDAKSAAHGTDWNDDLAPRGLPN